MDGDRKEWTPGYQLGGGVRSTPTNDTSVGVGVGRRETKGNRRIPTPTRTLANGKRKGKRDANYPRDVGYHPTIGAWPQGESKPIPMRVDDPTISE